MNTPSIDAARLTGLFTELRLPTIKALWPQFTEQADQEGWPGARLLSALAEAAELKLFCHLLSQRGHTGSPGRTEQKRLPAA